MAAVKVPADVELEDRLAFGLTARQLALLAATALSAYGALPAPAAPLLPTPLAARRAAAVVTVGGMLLALVRHDGLSGDQLALASPASHRPKRQLLAPERPPRAARPAARASRGSQRSTSRSGACSQAGSSSSPTAATAGC